MKNYYRLFLLLGSFFGFSGVALGAFGTHGLKSIASPEMLSVFETGARYQMYHAFALFLTALLYKHVAHRYTAYAGLFYTAGIILFSGSLYILALTGVRSFGMVTPFGGICFPGGWLMSRRTGSRTAGLFLSAFKIKKEN